MQFGEESQERFPLPSRGGGSEGEEGASPQENRSALWKFITPHRGKTGVSVGGCKRYPKPPSSFKDDENKNGVSLIAPMSPCSYCSRCSRFMVLKRSVPSRFKAVRERVQGEGFPSPPGWEPRAVKEEEALVRTVRVVRGSWNLNGVSVVIFTAKCAKIANKKRSVPSSPKRQRRSGNDHVKGSVPSSQ